ncbi:MAG: K+/H+ antiporter subunit F [Paracoccus sp. (in: a-proteobacteria)]|uniref:K+/H+ antiporter subunit F n=1 Tax=Paracoccus sp. TaxID=267 RepID=UPI0026E0E8DD|nr:K+/H+ antiporter subunit F [Paracoccus sp. (in: a-proteobacteria)]MDO5631304.1 K+/H+ antiporter subunit F [Paracoccus sp. (in: a-proteobacteria)]
MSAMILTLALSYAQLALAAALVLACARMMRGPRAQDRVLAMDTVYVNAMLLILVLGMRNNSVFFFEAAAIIAILGFVTTVSLAKFLLRGEVIE